MFEQLIRTCIRELHPYSSARDEFSGQASVYLDANENPFNTPYNRYPDPLAHALKKEIASIKGITPAQIFTGNGSDEAIDLIIRIFCEPGSDEVLSFSPTYGMYQVCAAINNVKYTAIPLDQGFIPDARKLLTVAGPASRVVFICSPNNPTSNSFPRESILQILDHFPGIVVIDEAYIDFSRNPGFVEVLERYPRLVILQTLSKAWGLAGIRLGMAFAHEEIISWMNRVKYPYNVNILTQQLALNVLPDKSRKEKWISEILSGRELLMNELPAFSMVEKIFPSDANFLLVRFRDARKVFHFLMDKGIIVRDRSTVPSCEGCLRITVGKPDENETLLHALKEFTDSE